MVLNSLVICLFARGVYDEEIILQGARRPRREVGRREAQGAGGESAAAEARVETAVRFDPPRSSCRRCTVQTSTGMIDKKACSNVFISILKK